MHYFKLLKILLKILCLALATTFIFYWFAWAVESFVELDLGIYIFNEENKCQRSVLSAIFICMISIYFIYFIPHIVSIFEIFEKNKGK